MKRILFITCGVSLLLAIGVAYSIWRANQEPVTHTPNPLEDARTQLHQQLDQAKKAESQAEQQNWNFPERLRELIAGHQQRIEKLKDNQEAAEIVAYDRGSIDRLQKRIVQIGEEEAARAQAAHEAAKEAATEAGPGSTQP